MSEYSVLIVDDEEDVANAIIRKIDWKSIGFSLPVYAANGLDALDLAEESQPDVVMTDIKMPYMDGLELGRNLKNLFPNIRIVFFSGFDEFEYVKEAIHVQAEEYILKPVDAEELKGIFQKLKNSLDREMEAKQNVKLLETYYQDSLPVLQENFYSSLIEGKIKSSEIEKSIKDYQIDLHGPLYCVAVIHTSATHLPEGITPMLLSVSVRKLAEERLDQKWNAKFFSNVGNTVALAQLQDEQQLQKLTDDCDALCRMAKTVCKAVVTVGVGAVCSNLSEIPNSYSGARSAVTYRVLYGTGKAINITEIAPQETAEPSSNEQDQLQHVFKATRVNDDVSLKEAVHDYITCSLHTYSNANIQEYHIFIMGLISELYQFTKNNQLDIDQVFQSKEDILQTVQRMEKDDLEKWLLDICLRMQTMIKEKRKNTTKTFVSKAQEYVNENYNDIDLNVDKICAYLGVSSAYFSTVFKKETGKSFTNFLTDVRMSKAVSLLDQDEKTYVVAQKVGYSDPNYFSYVFKKQYGISPSKYKTGKN